MPTVMMTASEAREAADHYRKQADLLDSRVRGPFTFAGSDATVQSWAARNEAYNEQMARRTRAAAVALDAYADGIDAAAAPEFRPTSSDTNRLHRIRARLLALVPLDGTMSLADDVHRLDRALADAEARGRQHGLLAAAWLADSEYARTISRRDQEQAESPDREWWDASALGVNVARSAIVFLGHDAAEATRDE